MLFYKHTAFGLQAFLQINNATTKGGMRGIEAHSINTEIVFDDELIVVTNRCILI